MTLSADDRQLVAVGDMLGVVVFQQLNREVSNTGTCSVVDHRSPTSLSKIFFGI